MSRPWLSKIQKSSTNVDHLQNGQSETYENNLDDFTLYLSEVSSCLINFVFNFDQNSEISTY